jgi:hypothetical protein
MALIEKKAGAERMKKEAERMKDMFFKVKSNLGDSW